MKTRTPGFLILLAGFAVAPRLGAQTAAPTRSLMPDEVAAIDSIAQAELTTWRAPGMVLAVVRNDAVVHRSAYGVANVETAEPMTVDMMVSVASVTKTITAVTALALAAEGKLDLDAPVRTYLPWLPERLGSVTMSHLLSHTAGLADRISPVAPDPISGALAPIAKAMTDEGILAPPGAVFAYSNQGYVLAGCVIETVGGAPYARVVEQILFKPLGMTHSTFNPRVAMTYHHAQGHNTLGAAASVVRPFNSSPSWAPAGELITTVDDLSRLARALLSDGMLDGQRVLPPGLLDRMATARARGIVNFGSTAGRFDYGFGLVLRNHHGLRLLEHLGVYAGFGACFCLVPERGLAVIAVINGRFCIPQRTPQGAIEIAAGLEPAWAEPVRAPLAATAMVVSPGRYTNSVQTVEIILVDGAPALRDADRVYPIVVRADGNFEIPGYRPLLPIPATPFELLETEAGKPAGYLRLGWRLYRRLE